VVVLVRDQVARSPRPRRPGPERRRRRTSTAPAEHVVQEDQDPSTRHGLFEALRSQYVTWFDEGLGDPVDLYEGIEHGSRLFLLDDPRLVRGGVVTSCRDPYTYWLGVSRRTRQATARDERQLRALLRELGAALDRSAWLGCARLRARGRLFRIEVDGEPRVGLEVRVEPRSPAWASLSSSGA
jgi:hypothetical protein